MKYAGITNFESKVTNIVTTQGKREDIIRDEANDTLKVELRKEGLQPSDKRKIVLKYLEIWYSDSSLVNRIRANLTGAKLIVAKLERTNLEMANLRGANLRGANLEMAYLTGADLTGADLELAVLRKANLRGADLKWADLEWADLEWASLAGANLTGAKLEKASLVGANLERAKLTGANLRNAGLERAYLTGANLTAADLTGADLTWADLTGANLTGADLTWADLTGADLTGANLTGADLTGAILIGCDLSTLEYHLTPEQKAQAITTTQKLQAKIDKIFAKDESQITDDDLAMLPNLYKAAMQIGMSGYYNLSTNARISAQPKLADAAAELFTKYPYLCQPREFEETARAFIERNNPAATAFLFSYKHLREPQQGGDSAAAAESTTLASIPREVIRFILGYALTGAAAAAASASASLSEVEAIVTERFQDAARLSGTANSPKTLTAALCNKAENEILARLQLEKEESTMLTSFFSGFDSSCTDSGWTGRVSASAADAASPRR